MVDPTFARYILGELFWELDQFPTGDADLRLRPREEVEVISCTTYHDLRVRVGGQIYSVWLSWRSDVPPLVTRVEEAAAGMRVQFQPTLSSPWTEMEPVRAGTAPPGVGTPDGFLTVEDGYGHRLRVDIYGSADECCAFQELEIWSGLVILGRGGGAPLCRPDGG